MIKLITEQHQALNVTKDICNNINKKYKLLWEII